MEPVAGEIWQESDGVLVLYAGEVDGIKQWFGFKFGTTKLIPDEYLDYPIRRVLDPKGQFVPEVAEYLK
jgi:hypothetical protein